MGGPNLPFNRPYIALNQTQKKTGTPGKGTGLNVLRDV